MMIQAGKPKRTKNNRNHKQTNEKQKKITFENL